MKGVVIQPENKLALTDVQEPKIKEDSDVIVRVTTSAICGSDVHAKHGFIPGAGPGTLLGHEFVGVVEEAGRAVKKFKPGDRVNAAAATWCGTCPSCKRGDVQYCVNGGVWGGGEVFGKGLPGAQRRISGLPMQTIALSTYPMVYPTNRPSLSVTCSVRDFTPQTREI